MQIEAGKLLAPRKHTFLRILTWKTILETYGHKVEEYTALERMVICYHGLQAKLLISTLNNSLDANSIHRVKEFQDVFK